MPIRTRAAVSAIALLLTTAACGSREAVGNENAPAVNAALSSPAPIATPAPVAATANSAAPQDPAASQVDFAQLAGAWRVAGVAPGDGVQAYGKDDPAYMGRIIDIGPTLSWHDPKAAGATVDDRCEGPVTQHLTGGAAKTYNDQFAVQLRALGVHPGDPHGIECTDGHWGPEAAGGATLYADPQGALAMSWYDGIVLKLVRDKVPSAH